jgi:hypothetical protein
MEITLLDDSWIGFEATQIPVDFVARLPHFHPIKSPPLLYERSHAVILRNACAILSSIVDEEWFSQFTFNYDCCIVCIR